MANRPYILVYKDPKYYSNLPFGIGQPSILTLRYLQNFMHVMSGGFLAGFLNHQQHHTNSNTDRNWPCQLGP